MNAPAYRLRSFKNRHRKDRVFLILCLIAALIAVLTLAVLLTSIIAQGASYLSYEFMTTGPSRNPAESGILPSMVGTILICAICAIFAIPVGIATAILLEEYRPKARVLRWLHGVVQTNITNLAGVPSIVYGILGISAFAAMFNAVGSPLTPEWTIGQSWYDQYTGADGRAYFREVSHRNAPFVPAFDDEVTDPRPFEVRRPSVRIRDEQTGQTTSFERDVLIAGDIASEDGPRAKLLMQGNSWTLVPDAEQAASLFADVQTGDEVWLSIKGAVVPAKFIITDKTAEHLRMAGGMLDIMLDKPKGNPIDVEIGFDDEVTPIKQAALAEVGKLAAVLEDAIGRSPQFTEASAAAAASEALAAADLKLKEPDVFAMYLGDASGGVTALEPWISGQLQAMSGFTGRDVGRARRALVNEIERAELASRLGGVLLSGTNPVRIDHKNSWLSFPPYMQLPFGRGVFAGGLTLMLVVLPIIIVASQESLRAVPMSLRHGSLALGGTKWQSISTIALPAAIPGICTGAILAMSRAIGEAAPILILAGVVFINFLPANLMDDFTAMPLQIYNWASRPQTEFHKVAASGIIILLAILLSFNALAVFIRMKFTKPLS